MFFPLGMWYINTVDTSHRTTTSQRKMWPCRQICSAKIGREQFGPKNDDIFVHIGPIYILAKEMISPCGDVVAANVAHHPVQVLRVLVLEAENWEINGNVSGELKT